MNVNFEIICPTNIVLKPLTSAYVRSYYKIDIFKAKNKDEILEFMSRPIPFCRFCDVLRRKAGYKWETSEKDISE